MGATTIAAPACGGRGCRIVLPATRAASPPPPPPSSPVSIPLSCSGLSGKIAARMDRITIVKPAWRPTKSDDDDDGLKLRRRAPENAAGGGGGGTPLSSKPEVAASVLPSRRPARPRTGDGPLLLLLLLEEAGAVLLSALSGTE